AAPAGPSSGTWRGVPPACSGSETPQCRQGMGLAVVFPARNLSIDPRSGITRRHHVDPSVINKVSKVAVRRAGLTKHISAHTFRHSLGSKYAAGATHSVRA